MIDNYKRIITEIDETISKIRVRSGCSGFGEKTYLIAFFIYYFNCKTTLDLGVFTGGSLFPQATIHNKYTKGVVYGVDPYTRVDMEQHDLQSAGYMQYQEEFMNAMDFEELYNHVIEQISNYKFNDNIIFLRQRSDQANIYFKENNINFDLMFIDGNHDTEPALNDVKSYIPLLKEDGIFIMDDITWATLQPAYQYAKDNLAFIHEGHGYAIFQKTNKDISNLKSKIKELIAN